MKQSKKLDSERSRTGGLQVAHICNGEKWRGDGVLSGGYPHYIYNTVTIIEK